MKRRIDVTRTFWHLLFPLGAVEEFTRPAERNGQPGQKVKQTFDVGYCRSLVNFHQTLIAYQTRFGADPQCIPVSLQHAALDDMLGKELRDIRDSARLGDVLWLHFHEAETDATKGVWGLIEWTGQGLFDGENGHPCLSPTTAPRKTMRDGTVIKGPGVVEVGLVMSPALDTIGTIRNRKPVALMPFPAWIEIEGVQTPVPDFRRGYINDGTVISRSAILLEDTMSDAANPAVTETQIANGEARSDGGMPTAPVIDETVLRAQFRRMVEEPEMASVLEELIDRACTKRGYMKRENGGTPADPAVTETAKVADELPRTDSMPAVTDAVAQIEARAKKLEAERLNGEVEDLVRRGELLAKDVGRFITARSTGLSVEDMITNANPLRKPSGHVGGGEPDVHKPNATTVSFGELYARAMKECPANSPTDIIARKHKELIELEQRAGRTVIA